MAMTEKEKIMDRDDRQFLNAEARRFKAIGFKITTYNNGAIKVNMPDRKHKQASKST